ncbi:MAG: hypothetical protein QNJ78_03920 [Gammaproteobacteria bacterium]|nr:hypothetical protein [Gammaproteobacteria bacterium]
MIDLALSPQIYPYQLFNLKGLDPSPTLATAKPIKAVNNFDTHSQLSYVAATATVGTDRIFGLG